MKAVVVSRTTGKAKAPRRPEPVHSTWALFCVNASSWVVLGFYPRSRKLRWSVWFSFETNEVPKKFKKPSLGTLASPRVPETSFRFF